MARDISRIAEIERACFSLPWTEEQLRIQLGEGHIFLAAELDGVLCGYAGAQIVLDEGYIANVAVAPAYRRRGVAAALLREMRPRAMARGISFLTLEVRASNAPAIALYAGQGYVQVGRRKNYYANPREDDILMTWRPAAP
jgi:ribosomal-protein-alanine N-acetyltransferase